MAGLVDMLRRNVEGRFHPSTSLVDEATGNVRSVFTANESSTGIHVDEGEAMGWTALGAAIRWVAETVATLPLNVYQRMEPRGKELARGHRLFRLLHDSPNPEQTSVEFWESYISQIMLWGNGYAEIVRDSGGNVQALWPIHPDRVKPDRDDDGTLFYEVRLPKLDKNHRRREKAILLEDEIFHTRGFSESGVIGPNLTKRYKDTIGLGIATERYIGHFFGQGAQPGGVIEADGEVSEEAHTRMRDDWNAIHRGLDNSHRIAILEEGSRWRQITTDPEKAQALGLRQFQINEASRITKVPPHMLAQLERATFSNIEQQSLEFVIHTIRPWNVRLEARMRKDLFTQPERDAGLFAEFLVEGLLRGDSEARSQFYRIMFRNGIMTRNEIRAKENLNPLEEGEGGDKTYLQVSMMPTDRLGELPLSQRAHIASEEDATRQVEGDVRRNGNGHGGRQLIAGQPDEERAVQERIRIVESFEAVYLDAMERMVRGEVQNIRKAMDRLMGEGDPSTFRTWMRDYYFGEDMDLDAERGEGGHPAFARDTLSAVHASQATQVAEAAGREVGEQVDEETREQFRQEYTSNFARRYSASSRRQLQEVIDEAHEDPDGDPQQAVEQRTDEWLDGTDQGRPRAERWAQDEPRRFDNAMSKAVYAAAGILVFRWQEFGESCPYCRSLDGQIVSGESPFVGEGERLEPDGADGPLMPKSMVGHPPLHSGCDCKVRPGRGGLL